MLSWGINSLDAIMSELAGAERDGCDLSYVQPSAASDACDSIGRVDDQLRTVDWFSDVPIEY